MSASAKRLLFVMTSADKMGPSGAATGFHWEEMTTPYYILRDSGVQVQLASIRGGRPPHDPGSLDEPGKRPESVERFLKDAEAMSRLENTAPISAIDADAYDGVYLPGGHGTMWDMPDNPDLAQVVGRLDERGRLVAAVCHGPAGLISAKWEDGTPVVRGKRINSFTDAEERAVKKDGIVPFMLESRLRELGAKFESAENFKPHVAVDLNMVTGQNPMSAEGVALAMLQTLGVPVRRAA